MVTADRLRRHRLIGAFHVWAGDVLAASMRRQHRSETNDTALKLGASFQSKGRSSCLEGALSEWRDWLKNRRTSTSREDAASRSPAIPCRLGSGEPLPEFANIPNASTAFDAKLPTVSATLRRMRAEALAWFEALPAMARRQMCTVVSTEWVQLLVALRGVQCAAGAGCFLLSTASADPRPALRNVAFRPWGKAAVDDEAQRTFRKAERTVLQGLLLTSSDGEKLDTMTLTKELAEDGKLLVAVADAVSLGQLLCMSDRSARMEDAWWLQQIVQVMYDDEK